METINYKLSLDCHKNGNQGTIIVKKNDTESRVLIVSFVDDGKSYVIEDGCRAVFKCIKPDTNQSKLFNDCAVIENAIYYTITTETIITVGEVKCEITLYGANGEQLASPCFTIVVEDILYEDDGIESTNEYTALNNALTRAAAVKDGADGIYFTGIPDNYELLYTASGVLKGNQQCGFTGYLMQGNTRIESNATLTKTVSDNAGFTFTADIIKPVTGVTGGICVTITPDSTVATTKTADTINLTLTVGTNTYTKNIRINYVFDGAQGVTGEQGIQGENGAEYIHPSSHPASMITEDTSRNFITAAEKERILNGFFYEQIASSALWVIEHGLGKYPSVTVVDSGGTMVEGEVIYISDTSLKVKFNASFSGHAYLN